MARSSCARARGPRSVLLPERRGRGGLPNRDGRELQMVPVVNFDCPPTHRARVHALTSERHSITSVNVSVSAYAVDIRYSEISENEHAADRRTTTSSPRPYSSFMHLCFFAGFSMQRRSVHALRSICEPHNAWFPTYIMIGGCNSGASSFYSLAPASLQQTGAARLSAQPQRLRMRPLAASANYFCNASARAQCCSSPALGAPCMCTPAAPDPRAAALRAHAVAHHGAAKAG